MLSKRIRALVEQAAKELDLPIKESVTAYRQYWVWARTTIEQMELDGVAEEDFVNNRTSINIPNIGKFHSSFNKVQRTNKRKEYIDERTSNKKGSTAT